MDVIGPKNRTSPCRNEKPIAERVGAPSSFEDDAVTVDLLVGVEDQRAGRVVQAVTDGIDVMPAVGKEDGIDSANVDCEAHLISRSAIPIRFCPTPPGFGGNVLFRGVNFRKYA